MAEFLVWAGSPAVHPVGKILSCKPDGSMWGSVGLGDYIVVSIPVVDPDAYIGALLSEPELVMLPTGMPLVVGGEHVYAPKELNANMYLVDLSSVDFEYLLTVGWEVPKLPVETLVKQTPSE